MNTSSTNYIDVHEPMAPLDLRYMFYGQNVQLSLPRWNLRMGATGAGGAEAGAGGAGAGAGGAGAGGSGSVGKVS